MKHEHVVLKQSLKLRPVVYSDLEQVRNWRNQESIKRWFNNQEIISAKEEEKWFEKYLQTPDDIMFIVEWEDCKVGTVALYHINNKSRTAEFGRLMIGEDWARGLGLGKQITQTVCEFGFEVLGLNMIRLEVFKDNLRAIKIYEALGFVLEKKGHSKEGKLYQMSLTKPSLRR